jgi:AraC-like DNA-binding protein
MSDRLFFTTDALPKRDRFPAFCQEVGRRYTGLDLATQDPSGFHGAIELQCAGSIGIGHNSIAQINSARTKNLLRDGDDSILVSLIKYGEGHQTQLEHDERLGQGDAVICDCGYPGELNFSTPSQFWNVKIPRQRITSLLPSFGRFAGARLDKDPVARRLLFGYLDGLFTIDMGGGPGAVQLYEEHVIALVAQALGAGGDAHRRAERQGAGAVRRAAILREIKVFMSDPNLGAATVAARLGISPRYLRMLLEETGRSFCEHLLDRRLDRAAAVLRDPAQRHRKIAEIVFTCGFGDLSYFNRAFRRRYGVTPSDIREQSRRDDP